jgi:hypothetical protein
MAKTSKPVSIEEIKKGVDSEGKTISLRLSFSHKVGKLAIENNWFPEDRTVLDNNDFKNLFRDCLIKLNPELESQITEAFATATTDVKESELKALKRKIDKATNPEHRGKLQAMYDLIKDME